MNREMFEDGDHPLSGYPTEKDIDHEEDARVYDLAGRARDHFKDELRDLDEKYERRVRLRKEENVHPVCIVGHGRCGKDVAGKHLGSRSRLDYFGGCSSVILPMVAFARGEHQRDAWEHRHENREFWYRFCNGFRHHDPTTLVKMVLANADIVTGIRAWPEFIQCKAEGVFDHVIWINRMDIPVDPTMEYDAGDVIRNVGPSTLGWIDNNKGVDHLCSEALRVARGFGISTN